MSKKVTIHQNEYEKMKSNKSKKPKWVQEENPLLFYTFTQKNQKSKNYKEADRKLALADLSIELLKQKYDEIPEAMIHIFDVSGCTLFMNKNLKDTFFSHMEELYMEPIHSHFVDSTQYIPELHKDLKNVVDKLPEKYQYQRVIKTHLGEFFMKALYERIDKKNGYPLGYISTTYVYPIKNKVETEVQETKKKKTNTEIIQEKLKDAGINDDVYKTYKLYQDQVIMIDLLGRVIWMNELFKSVNFKHDNDLLDSLVSEFGFEVYNEGVNFVLKNLPLTYEISTINFKRVDSVDKHPFGYLVFFSTLTVQPNNPKDVANKFLSRVDLSIDILNKKFGDYTHGIIYLSLNGRFCYMNDIYTSNTKRSVDEDLMVPIVYIMLTTNPENIYLKEALTSHFLNKNETLQYSTDIRLSKGGRTKGKFDIKRIDTKEGTPYLYQVELTEQK